jgi:hypothetical protein
MTSSSSTRIPINPKVLASKLNTIKENILDINEDLKELNAACYLPQSVHPLLISAIRQSGFAAGHISNTLLVLNNSTAQEAGQ